MVGVCHMSSPFTCPCPTETWPMLAQRWTRFRARLGCNRRPFMAFPCVPSPSNQKCGCGSPAPPGCPHPINDETGHLSRNHWVNLCFRISIYIPYHGWLILPTKHQLQPLHQPGWDPALDPTARALRRVPLREDSRIFPNVATEAAPGQPKDPPQQVHLGGHGGSPWSHGDCTC